MNTFCTNCGRQMPDDSPFCTNCGAPLAQPAAAPAAPNAAATTKPKTPIMAIVYGIVAIAAVIGIVITLFSSGVGGPGNPITLYEEIENGNFDNIRDMAPEVFWEELESMNADDFDISEREFETFNYDDYVEYKKDAYEEKVKGYDDKDEDDPDAESMTDIYGDNIEYVYEIVEKYEVSEDEYKDLKKSLRELGISSDLIGEKAYKVVYVVTTQGDESFRNTARTETVVEIDGDWYSIGDMRSIKYSWESYLNEKNSSSQDSDYSDYSF